MINKPLIHPVIRWLLKRITKKLVIQSHHHQDHITAYYQIMRDAAKSEFSEDNEILLNAFLLDCWHAAHKPTKENQL
jgi:NDP-sugar pyrophosphorylase family protein